MKNIFFSKKKPNFSLAKIIFLSKTFFQKLFSPKKNILNFFDENLKKKKNKKKKTDKLRQKDKKTKRQKDNKTKRQKDKKTKGQQNTNIKQ